VANAVGSANQSYYTHGFTGHGSRVYGSSFLDETDSSDEQKADFATGIEPCRTTTLSTSKTGCVAPPCNPPCEKPCATPPCNPVTLPLAAPGEAPCETPCAAPCGTPCGAVASTPCDTPCASPCASCGAVHQPSYGYGASYGCGSGNSYGLANGYGTPFGPSVPRVYCPPGPAPFTGTDPYAPGAVSSRNMLLQGISYGGVCAPPVGTSQLPCPGCEPSAGPQPWGAPALHQPTVQSAPVDPRFRAPVMPPQEGVVPTNYEGLYEPAFLPPLPLRGSVY
jgi:hypothetical protein